METISSTNLPRKNRGFLETALFPWITILRITGFCSHWETLNSRKNHCIILSKAVAVLHFLWCCVALLGTCLYAAVYIKGIEKEDPCRVGSLFDFLYQVVDYIGMPFELVYLMMHMRGLLQTDCKKLDFFVAKYFSRNDRRFVVVSIFIITVIMTAHTYVKIPSNMNLRLQTEIVPNFEMLFGKWVPPGQEQMLALLLFSMDKIVGIGRRCLRFLIVLIVFCLRSCFKQITQRFSISDSRHVNCAMDKKTSHLVVNDILADHTALCELTQNIDNKISVLSLVYYLCDMIFIIKLVFRMKTLGAYLTWDDGFIGLRLFILFNAMVSLSVEVH